MIGKKLIIKMNNISRNYLLFTYYIFGIFNLFKDIYISITNNSSNSDLNF